MPPKKFEFKTKMARKDAKKDPKHDPNISEVF